MINLSKKAANRFKHKWTDLHEHRGDCWKIFSLDIKGLSGIARLIHDKVPLLRKTHGGTYIMNWDEGMKLSTFIKYLSTLIQPNL